MIGGKKILKNPEFSNCVQVTAPSYDGPLQVRGVSFTVLLYSLQCLLSTMPAYTQPGSENTCRIYSRR